MRSQLACLGLVVVVASTGCASRGSSRRNPPPSVVAKPPVPGRSAEEIKAGFERAKRREPYLPMMSDEDAHKAMPGMFKGRPMPTLMLVAGLQPRTMEAVMAVAKQSRTEGELEPQLLNDVFWAVSSANECFY